MLEPYRGAPDCLINTLGEEILDRKFELYGSMVTAGYLVQSAIFAVYDLLGGVVSHQNAISVARNLVFLVYV